MKIRKEIEMEIEVTKEEDGNYGIDIDGEYVDFFREGTEDIMIDSDVAFFLKKILDIETDGELEQKLIEISK